MRKYTCPACKGLFKSKAAWTAYGKWVCVYCREATKHTEWGAEEVPKKADRISEEKGYVVNPVKAITDERGKNYGKPIDHFDTCQEMYDEWETRALEGRIVDLPANKQNAVYHGVHWIIDKLARAAENPMHVDNWKDIQGYAWCIMDALELNGDADQQNDRG